MGHYISKTHGTIHLAFFLIASLYLISCSEETSEPMPNPTPEADFQVNGNPNALEIGKPVLFLNLSINAARFQWSVVDGQTDTIYQAESDVLEYTFNKTGTYDIVLRAFSEDGQVSTRSNSVQIKRRILDAITIANISFVDPAGDPWDDDDSGPDISLFFGPQSDNMLERTIWTDTVENVTPATLPITWEIGSGSTFELSNELFDLFILDIDEEAIIPEDQAELMFGLEFNPVTFEFSAVNESSNGLMQISLDGFAIDLYFTVSLDG